MSAAMATATRIVSNASSAASASSSSSSSNNNNGMHPLSPTGSRGGILANAHEAPKKPIKPADNSFTSALKSAFIPQQAGKMMKTNGKPLGKSFKRTAPLPTHGHEGGEVLKRDPRGANAPCGDGVVLSSDEAASDDEEEVEEKMSAQGEDMPWSPVSRTSSSGETPPSDANGHADASRWDSVSRGRSGTSSSSMSRSQSQASSGSSTNPCTIKFAPLPSSGRLKRANSITIGVAARTHLLQSQGSARDNSAAWQAQANLQRYGVPPQRQQQQQKHQQQQQGPTSDQQSRGGDSKTAAVVRHDDTVDLGEEIRKGAMKAWRKMRRGGSVSSGSTSSIDGNSPERGSVEPVVEEEAHEASGEKTPKRSGSPALRTAVHDLAEGEEEPEGTRTPRHSMQRRLSTGTFIGNNAFMEIEEKRKRESRGDVEEGREESAQFLESLGRTHATRVAHHTSKEPWHPGMRAREVGVHEDGTDKETSTVEAAEDDEGEAEIFHQAPDPSDDEGGEQEDDESREAERMAEEALKAHSDKATKAGAVEKLERKKH